jgi:protein-tyrosine phosphatase
LLYRRKPRAFAASLQLLFETILRGSALPLLIHCHAGKDRTGFVIAMLLAAIGVGKADILDDYVTTSIFMPVQRESRPIAAWAKRSFNREIDPEQAAPLVEAHPEFLEAAFDQIALDWAA